MDDVKAALLGDREAAKRLTEQGVPLGCPYCKSNQIRIEVFRPSSAEEMEMPDEGRTD